MKPLIPILLFILCTVSSIAQTQKINESIIGKGFADKNLGYLKFINDSLMQFSLERDSSFYILSKDSLLIRDDYWTLGNTNGPKYIIKWRSYKIINFTSDSITLTRASKSLYDSREIEDTFFFISINKLIKPIDNFKSLRLEMISPFGGNYIITVNYLGAIAYNYESRDILPDDKKEKKKYFGKFSKTELVNFKKTLAESLYWSLPEKRECSGTDPVNSTILITEKNRVFKSTGCGFTYVHGRLISYLLDLDKNPGFIKSKPFKPTKQK